jgi:hypothetical protein
LASGDPCIIRGINLFGDGLVSVGDRDMLIRRLLNAGDEALKLGGANSGRTCARQRGN